MSPRQIGLLAALSAVWGGSYLLIKYALEDLEPAVIVWVRLVLAAVVLYAVMRLRGGGAEARAAHAELRARPWRALLLGTVAIALPFNLITFGELEVPSGLTAVLIAPASLFVAAFAPLIDPSEKVPAAARSAAWSSGWAASRCASASSRCTRSGRSSARSRWSARPPATRSRASWSSATRA